MSFMLNCPECGAKPSLELDRNTEWYSVECKECTSVHILPLESYRKDVDTAVCDWNEQVLGYLYKDGKDEMLRHLLEELEKFPAWGRYIESRGDHPFR